MDGITNPPIDELLDKAGSKYSLVLYAAKRARQINAYYSQLGEGLLEYVGGDPGLRRRVQGWRVHGKSQRQKLRRQADGLWSPGL